MTISLSLISWWLCTLVCWDNDQCDYLFLLSRDTSATLLIILRKKYCIDSHIYLCDSSDGCIFPPTRSNFTVVVRAVPFLNLYFLASCIYFVTYNYLCFHSSHSYILNTFFYSHPHYSLPLFLISFPSPLSLTFFSIQWRIFRLFNGSWIYTDFEDHPLPYETRTSTLHFFKLKGFWSRTLCGCTYQHLRQGRVWGRMGVSAWGVWVTVNVFFPS